MLLEDEAIIAFSVEDMLIELGCSVVGPAMNLDEAMTLATGSEIDAAVLDVNINSARSYTVARELERREVPFVFASGYGEGGVEWDGSPVEILPKPYRKDQLERVLTDLLSQN
ncbi:response regulator [Sphingomonas sinipercae]|uniref:Response regulator n=2 Tax=Sphingomonas sinipercae TaxID=2714944 RepID=A0A6G7ZR80_9SPHN|nr:response regulator [Sphingomonas sinipercae]